MDISFSVPLSQEIEYWNIGISERTGHELTSIIIGIMKTSEKMYSKYGC